MKRSLSTILLVAAISGWISYGERAAGVAAAAKDWVRTADGWESRQVLAVYEPSTPPAVHPGVIAAFQLGASLFFLAAFPARVTVRPVFAAAVVRHERRRISRGAVVAG